MWWTAMTRGGGMREAKQVKKEKEMKRRKKTYGEVQINLRTGVGSRPVNQTM